MGSNRPNLSLWVRPMSYSASSLSDLLAFLPVGAKKAEDFDKTIFYFKTRKLARVACDRLCAHLPPEFRKLLYPFTATNSDRCFGFLFIVVAGGQEREEKCIEAGEGVPI